MVGHTLHILLQITIESWQTQHGRRFSFPSSNETSFHVPLDQELLNQFREQHTPGPSVSILTPDMVNAICQSCLFRSEPPSTLFESLSIQADAVPESYMGDHGLPVIPALYHSELRGKQRADPNLREVIHQMETGEKIPPAAREELPEILFLLRELKKLALIEGVLYRKRQDHEQTSTNLFYPKNFVPLCCRVYMMTWVTWG